jgi:molecular chaperone Hsp33
MNRGNTVRRAGGFIIQLMPYCREETIAKLEANLAKADSVTSILDKGATPEEMLGILLEGLEVEPGEVLPVRFQCNCSQEKIKNVLLSLGKQDYQEIIDDGEDVEVCCRFCGKKYRFSTEELIKWRDDM